MNFFCSHHAEESSNESNQTVLKLSSIAKSERLQKSHPSTTNLFPSSKTAKEHSQKPAQEISFRQETHFLNLPPPLLILSPSSFSSFKTQKVNLADTNIRSLVDTVLGRTLATSGRLLVVVVGTLVLLADVLDRLCASLCDGGGVAVVAVDADEVLAVCGFDVVDDDFSGTTVL
jgi:hypothetical protein